MAVNLTWLPKPKDWEDAFKRAAGERDAKRQWDTLTTLAKHVGMVMTHRQLLEQVGGPGHAHQMQYLRVYMTQLRHKIEATPARPKYLLTEPGIGYRLKAECT